LYFPKNNSVIVLYGASNVKELEQVRGTEYCHYDVVKAGNLDPTASEGVHAGRVYLLFKTGTKTLRHIILTALHPEMFISCRATYCQAHIQDLVTELSMALSYTPLEIVPDFWFRRLSEIIRRDITMNEDKLICEAMTLIRQEVATYQVINASSDCLSAELASEIQSASHSTSLLNGYLETNRPSGSQMAWEVNAVTGHPGLQKAHEVNVANGYSTSGIT
jgi:hypothetical protein